jgi:hypothetical protein
MATACWNCGVSKSFRTESIMKCTLTTINTLREATWVMATKLTRLAHKIAIQLHLVAERCTKYGSRSRRPVRKLLDTPLYTSAPPIRLHGVVFIYRKHRDFTLPYLTPGCKYNFALLCYHLWPNLVWSADRIIRKETESFPAQTFLFEFPYTFVT